MRKYAPIRWKILATKDELQEWKTKALSDYYDGDNGRTRR